MSDGGRHFHNTEVEDFCAKWSCKRHVVDVLKRLCAPNLGENEYDAISWESLPNNWPNHLDEAVTALNYRILEPT
ncbi:hypothetical protein CY34DRAFT_811987 [Suillus luteus UH-Slu-Lm8-n1]|uniref:Integrase catalytic domain-containing protein n=1 Tax=Suillus luteus UH-Slu-Lm8-n1 TaxID=930992 RepID=A0A0D0AC22_9AGAM|nr:hypothetical protein CY34DRAFT_811987 [Suillus luteus UH-Slu-Lm8-n1]